MDERGQGFEKAADLVKKRVEPAVLQQFSHGSARPKVLQHVASVCICAILWQHVATWQRLRSHHTPIMPGFAHVCPGIPECSRPTAGEDDGRESFAPSAQLSQLSLSQLIDELGTQHSGESPQLGTDSMGTEHVQAASRIKKAKF